MRQLFNAKLDRLASEKRSNSGFLTKEKYTEVISEIKQIKEKIHPTPLDLQKLKRFDIINVGGVEQLIYPTPDSKPIYYVTTDELFDIVHDAHLLLNHGGRNKMIKEINKQFKNVTREIVMIYLHMCNCRNTG